MRLVAADMLQKMVAEPNAVDVLIGTKIRLLRNKASLTEANFAQKINVSEQLLFEWEAGQTRVPALGLMTIAQQFGQPISYFFARGVN